MRIIAQRAPADYQGPDIVDDLLTSELAGIARGRREINYHCSHRTKIAGNCLLLPYIATGSLVQVTRASGRYRATLASHAITVDISEDGREFTVTSAVVLEKEGLQ